MEQLTPHNGETVQAPQPAELGRNAQETAMLVGHLGEIALQDVEVYYHGSNFPFKAGDQVRPGGYAIRKDGVDHASAATHEGTAWVYAEARASQYGGRAKVFKVVPSNGQPAQRLGPQIGEVNSPRFTVVDEINIKPNRQGTIPGIDWSKHYPYAGANHPEDPLWVPEPDPIRPASPSPNEAPLPGLGEEYVKAEKELLRIKAGIPLM